MRKKRYKIFSKLTILFFSIRKHISFMDSIYRISKTFDYIFAMLSNKRQHNQETSLFKNLTHPYIALSYYDDCCLNFVGLQHFSSYSLRLAPKVKDFDPLSTQSLRDCIFSGFTHFFRNHIHSGIMAKPDNVFGSEPTTEITHLRAFSIAKLDKIPVLCSSPFLFLFQLAKLKPNF